MNKGIRRTIFFPKWWPLTDLMYPRDAVSENLLIIHDLEGDGETGCDETREDIITFSDELEQEIEIRRSRNGDVIFEIDLDGVPLGFRREIDARPTLREILEMAWDVMSECTLGDDWMSRWYATHLIIRCWNGNDSEDEILIHCVRENAVA